MRSDIEYTNRQIIPRWLPYRKSSMLSHSSVFNRDRPNEIELSNFQDALKEWTENKSVSFAINLIASSHILGIENDSAYRDAIKYIIDNKEKVAENRPFEEILGFDAGDTGCCIEDDLGEPHYVNIHETRIILKNNPTDSIAWMDLAFYYVLEGQVDKAERCIKIALNINDRNYHILRSAARFYIYRDDPQRALDIIRSSASLVGNPMLISSEISISEAFNKRSRLIKNARDFLADENFSPSHLSELSATLATLEFNSGSVKKGKRLLEKALLMPNENTLAQAQYLIRKFDGNLDPSNFEIPCKYEADAWNNYQLMDFLKAIDQSEKWFFYQPFSSRPAILYSYLQSLILENDNDAIRLLNSALKLSDNNFSLLNNKAVALAKTGEIGEAEIVLKKLNCVAREDEDDIGVLKATCGLIEFKKGNPSNGRKLYQEAIDIFKRNKNPNKECIALYHWFKEEELVSKERGEKLFQQTRELAEKYNYGDIKYKLRIE